MDRLIYKDESYAIIGAAMEVHNTPGPGFLEAVFQKALEMEFAYRNIPFLPQVMLDVSYKGEVIENHTLRTFLPMARSSLKLNSPAG
jgi:GxxExxY protein